MRRPARSHGFRWSTLTLVLSGLLIGFVAAAMVAGKAAADAPGPVPSAMTATLGPVTIVNGVARQAVTVSGRWTWPTHNSDCNADRAGVGFAIDWNDPGQPGNVVTTLPAPIGLVDVGAAAANPYNPADNEVHPTPAEPGTSTVYNDPNVTPPTTASAGIWRSGCGTYINGTPQGRFGPISHVYTQTALSAGLKICAIFYDVHGSDARTTALTNGFAGGVPKDAAEITAGGSNHSGDNSAEKNADTPLGNTCSPISLGLPSSLALTKTASPTTYTTAGTVITYTYRVTNTGASSLAGPFSISDDKLGTINPCGSGPLAAGAATTCTGTYTITAADVSANRVIINTATASGNGLTSLPASAVVAGGGRGADACADEERESHDIHQREYRDHLHVSCNEPRDGQSARSVHNHG